MRKDCKNDSETIQGLVSLSMVVIVGKGVVNRPPDAVMLEE